MRGRLYFGFWHSRVVTVPIYIIFFGKLLNGNINELLFFRALSQVNARLNRLWDRTISDFSFDWHLWIIQQDERTEMTGQNSLISLSRKASLFAKSRVSMQFLFAFPTSCKPPRKPEIEKPQCCVEIVCTWGSSEVDIWTLLIFCLFLLHWVFILCEQYQARPRNILG